MLVVSDRTAIGVVIGAVSAVVFMGCLGRRKQEKQEDKQGRRWSYTSVGIARGTFPKFVEFPEPIIHGAIFFRDCPSKEEVVSDVVTKVVEYERFATVPDWKAETGKHIDHLDVSRLVRHVTIDCDQRGVFGVLEQLLHEPLVDGRVDLPWWEFVIYEVRPQGACHPLCVLLPCLIVSCTEQRIWGECCSVEDSSCLGRRFVCFDSRGTVRDVQGRKTVGRCGTRVDATTAKIGETMVQIVVADNCWHREGDCVAKHWT